MKGSRAEFCLSCHVALLGMYSCTGLAGQRDGRLFCLAPMHVVKSSRRRLLNMPFEVCVPLCAAM